MAPPSDAESTSKEQAGGGAPRQTAWLLLVTLACLLPFVGRAFHIDDPLFVWAGDHIRSDPFDFFGFTVNWTRMTDGPMYEMTKNPPLVPYFIAVVRALFGEGEVALHLAFLLPAVAVVLGTARLARAWAVPAEAAALMTLLTPVFLASATTVMCDVTMLAFWVWAVVLWDRGIRREDRRALLAAASLAGLAFLSKYFGIALLPLLLAHGLALRRRPGAWILFLLLPLAVVALYEAVTLALYGQGLFSEAVSFSSMPRSGEPQHWVAAGATGMVFTGGCLLPAAFFAHRVLPRRAWLAGLACVAVLLLVAAFGDGRIGPGDRVALQRWLFFAAGAFLLLLSLDEAWRRPGPASLVLLLWIGGTFCFATWINWVVNARAILPMAPAAGLLLARRIGEGAGEGNVAPLRQLAWPLAAAACLSLAVAASDRAEADAPRRAARELLARNDAGSGSMWCAATWGFKFYLERGGAKLADASGTQFAKGDLLVSHQRLWTHPSLLRGLKLLDEIELRGSRWLATMDRSAGAGFYAASFAREQGPLPFVLGPVPPRRFYVMAVTRPLEYRDTAFDKRATPSARPSR